MSKAMATLQAKIGATADGEFGPNTARAIAKHFNLSPERGAHLMGQASHESGGFKRTRESLYYSTPERIQAVWPSRFPTVEDAEPYARNPAGLAGKVYAGRLGNENEAQASLYIGRGFLQLTGRNNYRSFASDMGVPKVMTDPDLVADEYAFETALWFFNKNKLFAIADEGVTDDAIKRITRKVNGGYHGLDHRSIESKKIHTWLLAYSTFG
jgi:putative chitinase